MVKNSNETGVPRKRGKDKSQKTYEKYGKHTNRNNRIKQYLLDKRKCQTETEAQKEANIENKLYQMDGPAIANQLALSLCLQRLHKN
tara:strand:+ start:976 stop:1236 length:261 start_codon:yes stop_codon:yes gene_type:complete